MLPPISLSLLFIYSPFFILTFEKQLHIYSRCTCLIVYQHFFVSVYNDEMICVCIILCCDSVEQIVNPILGTGEEYWASIILVRDFVLSCCPV